MNNNTKATCSQFDLKGLQETILTHEKVTEKLRKTQEIMEISKAQKQSNLQELEKLSIPDLSQNLIQFNISQSPIKDYNELDQISSSFKSNLQVNIENQNLKRKKADKLKEEGNSHYNQFNYKLAVQKYSEALDLQPDNKALWLNRAISFIKLNEFSRAIEDCSQVLKIAIDQEAGFTKSKDHCFKAFLRRAFAKTKKGLYFEALEDVSQAIRLDQIDSEALQLKMEIEKKLQESAQKPEEKYDKQIQVDLVCTDQVEQQIQNVKTKDVKEDNSSDIKSKIENQITFQDEKNNVQLNYKDAIDNFTESLKKVNIYSPSDTRDCSPESDKQKLGPEKFPQALLNDHFQRSLKDEDKFLIQTQLFAVFKSVSTSQQNKEEWAAYFNKKKAIEVLITVIKQDQEFLHEQQNLIPSLPALILQHYFEVSYIYQGQFYLQYNGVDIIFFKVIRLLQKAEGKKNSAIFDTISDYFDVLNIMHEEKIRKIIQKSPQIQTMLYPEIFGRIMSFYQTETNLMISFLSFCANLCYDQDSDIRQIFFNSFEDMLQQFKLIYEQVDLDGQTSDMYEQLMNLITNLLIEERFRKKFIFLDLNKEFFQVIFSQVQQLQNIYERSFDELKLSYLGFFLNLLHGSKISDMEHLYGELQILKVILESYNQSRNIKMQERISNLYKLLNQCYLLDNVKQKNSER